MAYEIKEMLNGVVSVAFNGNKPWEKITVPIDEHGNYDLDGLTATLNHIDFFKSASPNNLNDVEALVVPEVKTNAECASCARKKRNYFLQLTDYTQMVDSPLSDELKSQTAIDRQTLRDITSQSGFPDNIEWPELSVLDSTLRQEIIDMDFCGG